MFSFMMSCNILKFPSHKVFNFKTPTKKSEIAVKEFQLDDISCILGLKNNAMTFNRAVLARFNFVSTKVRKITK